MKREKFADDITPNIHHLCFFKRKNNCSKFSSIFFFDRYQTSKTLAKTSLTQNKKFFGGRHCKLGCRIFLHQVVSHEFAANLIFYSWQQSFSFFGILVKNQKKNRRRTWHSQKKTNEKHGWWAWMWTSGIPDSHVFVTVNIFFWSLHVFFSQLKLQLFCLQDLRSCESARDLFCNILLCCLEVKSGRWNCRDFLPLLFGSFDIVSS